MTQFIGNGLIVIGIGFILIGSVSVLLLPNLYARLLACAQIDTMGMMAIIIGLLFISPNSAYSIKIILIFVFVICINPISSYTIGRSAYIRGERPEKRSRKNG